MKKKFFDVKTAVAPAFCFMIILSLCGCAVNKEYVSDDYSSQPTYGDVHMISMDSDDKESSYKVGAALPSTEFSSVGRMLEDKVTQEWKTYDEMTKEEILLSSHLYGLINFETDTWKELEEAIGFSVYNPLEALSLLNKTGHIGTESAEPITPMKHIEVIADTANAERKLREIRATSGYSTGNVRITLTATLSSEEGMYTIGCVSKEKVNYEHNTVTTGSGIPVLIVISDGTDSTRHKSGGYYDHTAYWVRNNVFYTFRVTGDTADKTEIQTLFNRILEEI